MPVYEIPQDLVFPDPNMAEPDGLLGIGGDLSPERLLLAYQTGIFPWYSEEDPIMWWSPDPRCVIFPDKLRVSKSLKQTIKKGKYSVRFNTCFEKVIENCATSNGRDVSGSWIQPDTIKAYSQLNRLGYAHSVETFFEEKLVGGLYGLIVGKVFCGESMFHLMNDASKVALYYLVEQLKKHQFKLIDCQIPNEYLLSMGAEEISRTEFLRILRA